MLSNLIVAFAMQDPMMSLLEAKLQPKDLTATGAQFCRRIASLQAGIEVNPYLARPLTRVEGDPTLLVATLLQPSSDQWHQWTVLLWVDQGRVRSFRLAPGDSDPDRFFYPVVLRRRGNRIAGCLVLREGNSGHAVGVVLRKEGGMWHTASTVGTEDDPEVSSARFLDQSGSLVVETRDYSFKSLDEAQVGPLLTMTSTWTLEGNRYRRGKARLKRTALASLDDFCDAVLQKDQARQRRICPNAPLRRRAIRIISEEKRSQGVLHCGCVGNEERDNDTIFGFQRDADVNAPRFFKLRSNHGVWTIVRIASEASFARERRISLP